MKGRIQELGRESLQKIILDMTAFLTEDQRQQLERLIAECAAGKSQAGVRQRTVRMSQELVDEKMEQLKIWMEQIDEGELYLDTEEYEDYSDNYWNRDWIVEYHDNQGVGDKLMYAIQLAKDCVDDCRYAEAQFIYEWLWQMEVMAHNEYVDETDPASLERLVKNKIVKTDIRQLALLTLYADYQALDADKRAQDLYLYFSNREFQELHIEDMFQVGRENLPDTDRFWADWTALLKTKSGDVEARLLQEAVLFNEGVEELVKIADETSTTHPSLYLAAIKVYDKNHDYDQIEKIGARALEQLEKSLKIRAEIALWAAYAASCQMHTQQMMQFCWECFASDSTVRNYLRLFGTKEMAVQYGMRGREILRSGIRTNRAELGRNRELCPNFVGDFGYHELCFYTGDFEAARHASKDPQGSLGWSSSFIRQGIRLFLLYLYEKPRPSMAAAAVAQNVGFEKDSDQSCVMAFESAIEEESRIEKTSVFWNYFRRWKQHFQMDAAERRRYLAWAEKIVCSRADAIVGGQHRGHYEDVAILLAMTAEIKQDMGMQDAMQEMYAQYKKKFPRHSSFQGAMKRYFGIKG